MCRAKTESGRRCKSSTPEYRREKRLEKKRLAEAAVEGTQTTPAAPAPTREERREAETRYGNWADYARFAEISAAASDRDEQDLDAALATGRPIGAWTVHDSFTEDWNGGLVWALVEFDPDALDTETRDYFDNEVGWEATTGIATRTVGGNIEFAINGSAREAFEAARTARVTGDTPTPYTDAEVAAATARVDHHARVVAARKEEADRKAKAAAERLNANRGKANTARAAANEVRKAIETADSPEEFSAALDAIYEADLSERTQEKLSDALVARRSAWQTARKAQQQAVPRGDRRDTKPPVSESYNWSRHQADLDALVDADDTPPRHTYVDASGDTYESVTGQEWVQWLRTKADQGNPAAAMLYTTGQRLTGWQGEKYHSAADAIRSLRYQSRNQTAAHYKALAKRAQQRHEEAAEAFKGDALGESNAREARIAGLVADAA